METYVLAIFFILLILLIFMSAFFSFSEMALSSVNKIKIQSYIGNNEAAKRKSIKAKRVLKFIENYNETITSIVIYNNIVNVLSTTIATLIFTTLFGESMVGYFVSFIFMTITIIIFGELLPKMLAKKYSEQGSILFSFPLLLTNYSMKPITLVLRKMVKEKNTALLSSDEEINIAIEESTNKGVTSEYEKNIIKKALDLDETTVKDVMIPKEKVATISSPLSIPKAKKTIQKNSHSRFPILNKDGDIESIFSIKQFLIDILKNSENINLENYKYDYIKFDENENVFNAFESLRNRREKMAIVIDKNEKFSGVITIEDITEIIFGEIYDEDDIEEDGVYKLNSHSFIVSPNVKLSFFIRNYLPKLSIANRDGKLTFNEWVNNLAKGKLKIDEYIVYKNIIIWAKEDKINKTKVIFEVDLIE